MQSEQQLIQILQTKVPCWSQVPKNFIKFTRLSGLTNTTYKVSAEDKNTRSLVMQIFGDVQGCVKRERQHAVFKKISEAGLGPRLLYGDGVLRIQQFMEGYEHPSGSYLLSEEGLQKMAESMSRFHDIQIPEIVHDQTFIDSMLSQKFMNNAQTRISEHQFSENQRQIVDSVLKLANPANAKLLRAKLRVNRPESIRLCHNDLNHLNIMIDKTVPGGRLYFIDYEYARYNYVAYQIANFLVQAMIDYTWQQPPFFKVHQQFKPTTVSVRSFVQKYCLFIANSQYYRYTNKVAERQDKKHHKNPNGNIKLDRDILVDQVLQCLALCNFYWTVWSFMIDHSEQDFDYFQYGRVRLQLFHQFSQYL